MPTKNMMKDLRPDQRARICARLESELRGWKKTGRPALFSDLHHIASNVMSGYLDVYESCSIISDCLNLFVKKGLVRANFRSDNWTDFVWTGGDIWVFPEGDQ